MSSMYERAKTLLLIFLVGSSIFLTWQIWTYEPTYESIAPTEYVAQEGLAQKKELQELVKPTMLVYHYGQEEYRVAYPDNFQYTVIQGQMKDWYFHGFREADQEEDYSSWLTSMQEATGIELIFPTGIPFSVLSDMFQMHTERQLLPTQRMWLYFDPDTEEVIAYFLAQDAEQLIKAKTGLSHGELKTYLALGESRPLYTAYIFEKEGQEQKLPVVHYVTQEPLEMLEHQYFYQRIPIESLIPYLFVDPSFVRQMKGREGGTFFTDGSKGLQYQQDQLSMYFFHPLAETTLAESLFGSYVQRSIQFVNQHQGWEQDYYLHAIEKGEGVQQVDLTFRKYLGNYPLYSATAEQDVNIIQLGMHNERVSSYLRPMFQVDKLMNQYTKQLPSGTQVVASLRAAELPMEEILSIELAYQSVIRDYYLRYIPYWVVQLRDGQRIFINEVQVELEPADEELGEEAEEEQRALE